MLPDEGIDGLKRKTRALRNVPSDNPALTEMQVAYDASYMETGCPRSHLSRILADSVD